MGNKSCFDVAKYVFGMSTSVLRMSSSVSQWLAVEQANNIFLINASKQNSLFASVRKNPAFAPFLKQLLAVCPLDGSTVNTVDGMCWKCINRHYCYTYAGFPTENVLSPVVGPQRFCILKNGKLTRTVKISVSNYVTGRDCWQYLDTTIVLITTKKYN